jgi:hypothetical protein
MARKTNAAAARTRRTAARVRTCAKARFLPVRRRVFVYFLAEVGVGVLIPYTFPKTQFASVRKKRSRLLILYFCNVDTVPDTGANNQEPALEAQESNPNAFGLIIYACYKAGSSAGACAAGSIHLPCSRMRSLRRSTASASGILNFTAVLPTYRFTLPGAPPT